MKRKTKLPLALLLLPGLLFLPQAPAQVTNVVFKGDFSKLNTNQFIVVNYSQEGGGGSGSSSPPEIAPSASSGVLEITGTTTEQWWAGGGVEVNQVFPANPQTNTVFSIDRVSMSGNTTSGGTPTAIRSAVFAFDPTLTYYILFGQDWTEDYWQYNQKVGLASDVPTGGGTAISAFNAFAEDESEHVMSIVCNGSTASLYLDGVLGVSPPFPFDQVRFLVEAEARAVDDIVDVTYSNLVVETVGFVAVSPAAATLVVGTLMSNLVVTIPPGANQSQAVTVTVTSDTPSVAVPIGGVNGALTLTFPAGGGNTQTFGIQGVAVGGAAFNLSNNLGMGNANNLQVAVIQGPGVRFTDDFAGTALSTANWQVDTNGFNDNGVGQFEVGVTNNILYLSGACTVDDYWPGIAAETKATYTATPELPLQVDVDRVLLNPVSSTTTLIDTGARSGVFLTTANRSQTNTTGWVFFSQDYGSSENNSWGENDNINNASGTDTPIPVFNTATENTTNLHHMELLANGTTVQFFLDGIAGPSYPFKVTEGIYVELGAFARAIFDTVVAEFANFKIQNVLPPVTVSTAAIETPAGVNTNVVTVTVPVLRTNTITVSVTSANPAVATPQGAANGVLTLTFPQGAASAQTFNVVAAGVGQTTFTVTNSLGLSVVNPTLALTVTTPTAVWFTDSFASSVLNANSWTLSTNSPGVDNVLIAGSFASITNGTFEMYAAPLPNSNPYLYTGYGLYMRTSFAASVLSPISFQVDRTSMKYILLAGTTTFEWTGVWVTGPDTNYVWFGDYDTHNGVVGGWEYYDSIGSTTNSPFVGVGVIPAALTTPALNDLGNHVIRVEANGSVVQFFVDGISGGSASFPYTNGISFGFGAYVATESPIGSIVEGYFAGPTVYGPAPAALPRAGLTITRLANDQFMISWNLAGTLQSSSSLTGGWTAVTPQPTGTNYTVNAAVGSKQYYRLLMP
jgi:hypothetical protein